MFFEFGKNTGDYVKKHFLKEKNKNFIWK